MTNLWLAPLHGITLYPFRNCLFRHIAGIKTAITPFFPIQETAKLNVRKHSDFHPENNPSVEIIPQLIGNKPDDFVDTVKAIHNEFGYVRFNWNIGCPMHPITRKKRGCGIMPYPEMVEEVVRKVTENTPFSLSLKMRLGMVRPDESIDILNRLNRYPIDFVVIHPRLGVQQYEGIPHLEAFGECVNATKHRVVYSGDIWTLQDYQKLKSRFPQITDWMLGRSILRNPFLAEEITASENTDFQFDTDTKRRFSEYYDDLTASLLSSKSEYRTLSNLKELWHYFAHFFQLSPNDLQSLLRIVDFQEFMNATQSVCKKR